MTYSPLQEMVEKIQKTGFCNAHAHFDRAYTVTREDLKETVNNHLFEKWKLVDEFKKSATMERYFTNFDRVLTAQKSFGVTSALSFVDLDPVCGERPLNAAIHAKVLAKQLGIDLRIANQTLKGVLTSEPRALLESRIEEFDVIGCLPRADEGREAEHLDVVMGWAKQTGKRLHAHVDQLNDNSERETELLARKTIEHGLEGRVTAVHSISLAAHRKEYRQYIYELSKDAGLSFVTCPTAWIDHRRSDKMSVDHNAITPVEELVENGLMVAIGSDNIHDIYKPYSDGDMKTELRVMLEATHFYNMKELIKIATTNGRRIIGVE